MMSSDYWRNRAKRREAEAKKDGEKLKKELFEEYEKAIKDIDNKISFFYAKYGKNNKITAEQAMKRLSEPEFKMWKKSLEEYSKEIENEVDKVKKAELKARLDALSYNSQISRLEALKEQIGASISSMSVKGQNKMTDGLSGIFASSMAKKAYDLSEKGLKPNIKIREKIFDENLVKEVLSYPWSGADYSERLWKNTNNLSNVLKQELTQGMIKGTALPQMSKSISEKMGQSFKVSERLIETETSRIHEEAQFKVYEAAGIEEYEFMAENELTTCSICGELDGQHFKLKDRAVGVNCNPMHPHCHCTTIEYDPEERLDYERSGLEYKPRQTYKEWLEEQRAIYGEEKLENKFKMVKNKAADATQYEKYKEALGKENMPKSLAEFQELKYNKSEEWKELKKQKSEINSDNEKSLSMAEKRALNRYISSGAYEINEKLRRGFELDEDDKDFITNLDKALEKMPNYEGNLVRTLKFRSEKARKRFIDTFIINDTRTFDEYLSTSCIEGYNEKANVKIYIQNSKKGKDIRKYNVAEKEILYQRNSRFKVLHIAEREDVVLILLEEE